MNSFSAINRSAQLKRLQDKSYDLLVIGGGITGSGIALDAVSRGLTVALIEMQDVAGGTSSRSTRLIHGGLRYLKQLEIKLVSEVAREREIIYRNAQHLVTPEVILLPITKTGTFGKTATRLAMWVYEFLARVKKEERHRYLTADDTWKVEPTLKREELLGGILYYEYRTDDARLTLAVLKEAAKRNATVVTYLKATGFIYDNGKINGVTAGDQLTGRIHEIKAAHVINAAGPWVDELDSLDKKEQGNKLQPTKGIHIVVPHNKLPIKQAVYFDTADRRMVFAIPHRGKTYIGTTDTFYDGDKINPMVTPEDKQYLVRSVNNYFSGTDLKQADIESCWAGIRPLIKKKGKNPSEISRKDEVFEWKSGLISIAGGKLSGYRKMAQRAVDLVANRISETGGKKISGCITKQIVLSGRTQPWTEIHGSIRTLWTKAGFSKEECDLLITRYGGEAETFLDLYISDVSTIESRRGLPKLMYVMLLYAIKEELCLTPADFFIRRTGMMYFERAAVVNHKTQVLTLMQEIFKWDQAQVKKHESELDHLIALAG